MPSSDDEPKRPRAAFPSTRRSALLGALSDDPSLRRASWERLARAYLHPIYAYLRLRWRVDESEASDLVQAFFERSIERALVAAYDPKKGRFRTFLRVCVDRFVIDERRAHASQKRGGGRVAFDPDAAEAELARIGALDPATDPEALFDAAWTRHVLALALDGLRAHCAEHEKLEHLTIFERVHLDDPDAPPSYEALAAELGLSAVTVQNRLAYARRHLRRVTLEILREITASDEEYRFEARHVLGVEL